MNEEMKNINTLSIDRAIDPEDTTNYKKPLLSITETQSPKNIKNQIQRYIRLTFFMTRFTY